MDFADIYIDLYEDLENLECEKWLSHPSDQTIDVVAINITEKCNKIIADRDNGNEKISAFDIREHLGIEYNLDVMDNIFIIGYPFLKRSSENILPIYKSATIASEPRFPGNINQFLVDGKTKKGMSGSPVILNMELNIQKYIHLPFNQDKKVLIGIYSGRDESDPDLYTAELGKVWSLEECLLAILNHHRPKQVDSQEAIETSFLNKCLRRIREFWD